MKMPCNSDYLAPNEKERYRKLCAELILYIQELKGLIFEPKYQGCIEYCAKDDFGGTAYDGMFELIFDPIVELCTIIRSFPDEEREQLIYGGDMRLKKQRQLIDYWEEHYKADRERQEAELALQRKLQEDAHAHHIEASSMAKQRLLKKLSEDKPMEITFTSSKGESCSTEANITIETKAILDESIFDPLWFDLPNNRPTKKVEVIGIIRTFHIDCPYDKNPNGIFALITRLYGTVPVMPIFSIQFGNHVYHNCLLKCCRANNGRLYLEFFTEEK